MDKVLFVGLMFLQGFAVSACDCIFPETFCQGQHPSAELFNMYGIVAHVRINSMNDKSAHATIKTLFAGNPASSKITILRGNQGLCGDDLSQFRTGEEYILRIRADEEHYELGICGVNWLPVVDGKVQGAIAPGIDRIPVAEFHLLADCGSVGSTLISVEVTPTLTDNEVVVKTTKDIPALEVAVYDMMGRMIFSTPSGFLLASDPLVIPLGHLSPGCYAVVTRTGKTRRATKVIVAL